MRVCFKSLDNFSRTLDIPYLPFLKNLLFCTYLWLLFCRNKFTPRGTRNGTRRNRKKRDRSLSCPEIRFTKRIARGIMHETETNDRSLNTRYRRELAQVIKQSIKRFSVQLITWMCALYYIVALARFLLNKLQNASNNLIFNNDNKCERGKRNFNNIILIISVYSQIFYIF